MNQIAVLIDAGYFWVQVTHVIHGCTKQRESVELNYNKLREVILAQVAAQFSAPLLRVYWYDGPPQGGGKADSHTAIDNLDDFKLRLGTRNSLGSQKGVDGMMIADLIGLAQSKSITGAILLSGDADLTPGVIAAQGLGIRVHLLSMGPPASTSPFLKAEVDRKARIEDDDVRVFAVPKANFGVAAAAAIATAKPAAGAEAEAEAVAVVAAVIATAAAAVAAPPFKEIAERALQELGGASAVVLEINGGLPRPVDGKLLYLARTQLGRDLVDHEKRALRKALRDLLPV